MKYNPENLFQRKKVVFATSDSGVDPELTTTNYINFEHRVQSLAVQSLYGCTSVVVVSKRGAWASHIWESTFIHSDVYWIERGYNQLMTGRGAGDDLSLLGIYELFNRPDLGAEGAMFDTGTDAQVFIMAPRVRRWPRFLMDDNGEVADPLFTDARVAGETDYALAWPNQVALLTSGMRERLVTTSPSPLLNTP